MGLFDSFKQYRSNQNKKNAERYGDTLKKKATTKEQRLEAIEALEGMLPEVGFPQLLKRYEMVVDSGMQDTREKELVEEILLRDKEAAKPFVRQAVTSLARVSWPVRIAERIYDREDYVALLFAALNMDTVLFDEAVNERNVEILLALKEVDDPGVVERSAKLVRSRDEHVRMAAVECLEAHAATSEHAKGVLLDLLKTEANDANSRFLGLVRTIVERHAWV